MAPPTKWMLIVAFCRVVLLPAGSLLIKFGTVCVFDTDTQTLESELKCIATHTEVNKAAHT